MPQVEAVRWAGRYHALICGAQPPRRLMLHANGFNGGTYTGLLERLAPEGGWAAPDFRGHGGSFTPERIRSWRDFVDDVAAWRADGRFDRPTALGHSLGGVTALMAEAFQPGTFRAIALLDPVIFPPDAVVPLWFVQLPGLRNRHPLVRGARARRMRFASRDEVVAAYAKKKAFATWERRFLEDYVAYGTVPDEGGGVRLACPGEIEAQIFSTWPVRFWFWVRRVRCPVLILRGATSDTFWRRTAERLARTLPNATLHEIENAGHFLPMERPDAVVERVLAWEAGLPQP